MDRYVGYKVNRSLNKESGDGWGWKEGRMWIVLVIVVYEILWTSPQNTLYLFLPHSHPILHFTHTHRLPPPIFSTILFVPVVQYTLHYFPSCPPVFSGPPFAAASAPPG